MRNQQLIRQWKILRYIAEGQFDIVELDLPELHEVFGKSYKTIKRDIHGLFLAGFLREYHFKSKLKRKKLVPMPELRAVVHHMIKQAKDSVTQYDLLRCNSCPYRFKTVSGRLDIHDFRAHKSIHT